VTEESWRLEVWLTTSQDDSASTTFVPRTVQGRIDPGETGDEESMPSFVGRAAELGFLRARLDEAASGLPRTVVLEGPGGSGKSALLHAFTSMLDKGAVLAASGEEEESFLSFGLLNQLLGSRASTWADPFAAGGHLLDALDQRDTRSPTVLAIDDAHLADSDSLTAISFALRRLHADPVLAVIVTRDPSLLPAGLLRLADSGDGMLHLPGLGVDEVVELASSRGHDGLSRQAAEHLRRHTGGNALYLRALMDDLGSEALRASTLPAPRSYGQLVLRTLAAQTEPARQLARALTVLPDGSPLSLVAGVAGLGDAETAVDALTRASLVACHYADDGWRLSFAHPMVRASVAEDLGPLDRKRLHTRAAELLPSDEGLLHRVAAASEPDQRLASDLAEYAARRQLAGDAHAAADLYLKASALGPNSADREHALLEAADLFLIAGDMNGARKVGEGLGDLPRTAHRLYLQARIAWFGGDPTAAEELAQEAWEQGGEFAREGRGKCAAILAQLHNLRGDGLGAAEWADRALAEDLPADLVDTTRAARAAGLALVGRMRDALDSLDTLPSDPRSCGPDQEHQLLARAALRGATDQLTGTRADLEALVGSSTEVAPQRLLAMGVLAEADFRLGRWDDAVNRAEHAISLAEASEQVWVQGFLHTQVAQVAACRGEWGKAEQHLGSARELAETLEDITTYAVCENTGTLLAMCRADPAQVLERVQVLALFRVAPTSEPGWLSWPVHYVSALVEVGRLDDAEEAIASFEEVARERGSRSRLASLARVRGELATARRDRTLARDCFEEALAVGADAVDALERGLVLTSYGRFLRRRGERRAAQDRLTAAREHFVKLGAQPFIERCDHELAASGLVTEPARPAVTTILTPQEQLVASLACKGMSTKEMAHHLVLSVKTVGYHLTNVYAKLDVHSRAQLMARLNQS